MTPVVYNFRNINCSNESRYIFQTVKGRKLSNVYHSHDFYEWIIILSGSCTQIINEKEIYSDKNTCILLCPGDRHRFIRQSDNVNLIALSVEKREVDRFADIFDITKALSGFQTILNSNQLRTVLDFYHSGFEEEYKLLLANLIMIYIDTFREKEDMPGSLKFAVKEMMKPENLKGGAERFTELSKYSKTHLNRLIKKHFNVTLHEYIINARLEAAYSSLILTKTNMEDLAEGLGYASFSHFNKIFKSKYGITPAALRKKHGSWTT
ncbi:MAG: AraC family transcriptional regulator [Clostridia bacterium]|nr:AraC family transcriptional regulator [Clostridia bacterium]